MTIGPSSLQSLRRVFHSGFSANDITEALLSCDSTEDAESTREFMRSRALQVLGIRRQGRVSGYIELDNLGPGQCQDYARPFDPQECVLNTATISEVVLGLKEQPRLFVLVFGNVGGIVTKTDLQKPPMRMWLFGMVTLIEMRMTQMIEESEGESGWHQYLSQGRLAKAETLLAERQRRQQALSLTDCLQFSDKCQIIARNADLRSRTRMGSRRQVEEAGKKLERLRNNLAHAQDIIATDWDAVIELTENVDQLLNMSQQDFPGVEGEP